MRQGTARNSTNMRNELISQVRPCSGEPELRGDDSENCHPRAYLFALLKYAAGELLTLVVAIGTACAVFEAMHLLVGR